MLEDDWKDTQEPSLLINRGVKSRRKKRLVAAACVRRVLRFLPDPRFEWTVNEAERFADGEIDWPAMLEVRKAFRVARKALGSQTSETVKRALKAVERLTDQETILVEASLEECSWAMGAEAAEACEDDEKAAEREKEAQFELLLDVEARSVKRFAPGWRTTTVMVLAGSIYADRKFQLLPDLGTALEKAGCRSSEILDHCRGDRPHVRGCWVVDLVLGKK